MAYGTMSIGNAGFTKKFISTLFLLMHPKGSLFHSNDPTSPAELYGGTWERIEGKFIMGASDTYPAGSTGGSATHTQTVDEIAPHKHVFNGYNKIGNGTPYLSGGDTVWEYTIYTSIVGGGKPMDILNPYYSVYIWRRVA